MKPLTTLPSSPTVKLGEAPTPGLPRPHAARITLPWVTKQPPHPCAMSDAEFELMELLRADVRQHRSALTCHPILSRVTRDKAVDMLLRSYFSHIAPEGVGPNYLVAAAGLSLPDNYSRALDGNQIESIALGTATAPDTRDLFYSSPPHRTHLWGLDRFFEEQTLIGVGFANMKDTPVHHLAWCVLTFHPLAD